MLRNVYRKISQILRNLICLPIFGVTNTPCLGSDVMFLHLLLVFRGRVIQRADVRLNCVCGFIVEDLTGVQAYDLFFQRASTLFCSINWVESSS